jgi:hypothetical protein
LLWQRITCIPTIDISRSYVTPDLSRASIRCDVTFSQLYTPCSSETKDVITSKSRYLFLVCGAIWHTIFLYSKYSSIRQSYCLRLLGVVGCKLYRLVYITNLMHTSFILQYTYYISCLDMFRAIICSSSGGSNCILQHLICHSEN